MLNELWWAVPNKLAGMRKPVTDEEVQSLKSKIAGIITVLDDEENHELYQDADMSYLWLPVTGGKVPSLLQVQQARGYYHEIISSGKGALAIHCSGGRKRTGTLIAAILAEVMTPDEALATVLKANDEIKLNEEQIQFVHSLQSLIERKV